MSSRKRLTIAGQPVILVYIKTIGFLNEHASFIEYKRIMVNNLPYEIPYFEWKNKQISGLDCFWILPEDAGSEEQIQRIQYELIQVQVAALEIGYEYDIDVPKKIRDVEITKMAKENHERIKALIEKMGFDPRDESWIENDLATSPREKNWFSFERKNPLLFARKWDDFVNEYNRQFDDEISVPDAKNLCKKRMRYLLGAFTVRQTGNPNKTEWVNASRKFEQKHRDAENRMLTWSHKRKPNFPLTRVIKPIVFTPGSYFHECIENIPHVFTDIKLNKIKEGIVLRVVSYDPVERYIRLDFTSDIRTLIKGSDSEKPWEKDDADYNFWVKPEEVDKHLKVLEQLG